MVPFVKKSCFVFLFICAIARQMAYAQATPFSAVWSFEDNQSSSVSHPNITTGGPSFSGVNVPSVGGYIGGQVGRAVNVANWSTSGCNLAEHVQFTVQPVSGQTMTLTQLSFYFNRSNSGPAQILVRSSVDNYSATIYTQAVTNSFQQATISLTGSAYTNQSGPISFWITACTNTASGGALRLDEVTINGTVTSSPLPVTLLSFTAKPEGDRTQLAWATTWEYNADHFRVERSRDLQEFITVGEVAATGTTDSRQYYGLTDLNPNPGINYYRLKQIDRDGTTQSFKPVSTIIQSDEPIVTVYPNPASPDWIHLRLWNADDASVQLLNTVGQPIGGRLERRPGEADLVFDQPLPAGLYWLDVRINGQKRVMNVVVR
ncbi:T9SS type A sorting domain-containing protein [Spirosoma migulaei]